MIVVIDANVLWQSLNSRHVYAVILDAWTRDRFAWALSTDILTEYQEVIVRLGGRLSWRLLDRLLDLSSSRAGSLIEVSPAFHFLAIPSDRDDDKFADCAITAHADFIITSDRHFRPLHNAGYKPQPISPEAFIECYLSVPLSVQDGQA